MVLIDGEPVSRPQDLPALVDGAGRFRTDMARTSFRIFFDRAARRQLEREVAAQFEAFAASGLPLDHVDCHKHWHLHPTIADIVMAVGRGYGLNALRVPDEPMDLIRRIEHRSASLQSVVTAAAATRLRAQVRRQICVQPTGSSAWRGRAR